MRTSRLPDNLAVRAAQAATGDRGITFVSGEASQRATWAELHGDAVAMAAALQDRGVRPRSHVAILGPTTRPLVTAVEATWLCGAAAVMLPLPMRMSSLEELVAQTRARVRHSEAAIVVVDRDLLAFFEREPGDPPFVAIDELLPVDAAGRDRARTAFVAPAIGPDDLAILQFTSGSTAEPKGVMLPHATVCANLDAITRGIALDPAVDVAVSWLPLYHDMGLIGLLAVPLSAGVELVLAGPQDFLASPGRWARWISDHRGSVTAGPNFSYALLARAMGRMDGLDLSSWRIALNGAEPVDPVSVERFAEAGRRHGLDPRAVFCAFGMAEATLAVSFPAPFAGMRTDTVERRVLETDRYAAPVADGAANARRFAVLGRPVDGLEVRVVDPATGDEMGEREVGELQLRGASVTPGYFRRPDATASAFDGDWLRTGDLAYLVEGELVVCGRMKDVIIIGGRNVWPEDVERAIAAVEGVRPGNVIAFGVDGRKGREAVVVVAEVRDPSLGALGVRAAVAERVRAAVGVSAEDVVLVAPGTLPKTSSGKLQRSRCRALFLDGELADVAAEAGDRASAPAG